MTDFYFYEEIACKLMCIDPPLLFVKTKVSEVVYARMMCMVFRNEYLKMGFRIAAERYNRDRTTAIHAIKVIKDYADTKHQNYKIWNEFIFFCKKEMIEINDHKKKEFLFGNMLDETISNQGFENYKQECYDLFIRFSKIILDPEIEESAIKDLLSQVHIKVLELNHLYNE